MGYLLLWHYGQVCRKGNSRRMTTYAYNALDRVRNLLIAWRNDDLLDQDLVTKLDEALSNCVGDSDTHKWLTGLMSLQDYFE